MILAMAAVVPVHAANMSLFGLAGGSNGEYSVRVRSLKEAKFRSTVRQQYDFSCGSAALATLLTYHYEHPVTETEVFQYMYARGDQAAIQREGFSLLDIKGFLEGHDYEADGFETSLDKLEEVAVPAIVLINENGYQHFVVIKGLRGNEVLIGDPSMGSRILQRPRFEAMWVNSIVFVITSVRETRTFNASADWRAGKAPLGAAISRESLANMMIFQRGPNDF
ncbi:MAG: C39 family peptidase [Burkholderiales bacterium]|nr:C39 family peptidase [Burkholderiales bacterium]